MPRRNPLGFSRQRRRSPDRNHQITRLSNQHIDLLPMALFLTQYSSSCYGRRRPKKKWRNRNRRNGVCLHSPLHNWRPSPRLNRYASASCNLKFTSHQISYQLHAVSNSPLTKFIPYPHAVSNSPVTKFTQHPHTISNSHVQKHMHFPHTISNSRVTKHTRFPQSISNPPVPKRKHHRHAIVARVCRHINRTGTGLFLMLVKLSPPNHLYYHLCVAAYISYVNFIIKYK